jgi:hypothetical protein
VEGCTASAGCSSCPRMSRGVELDFAAACIGISLSRVKSSGVLKPLGSGQDAKGGHCIIRFKNQFIERKPIGGSRVCCYSTLSQTILTTSAVTTPCRRSRKKASRLTPTCCLLLEELFNRLQDSIPLEPCFSKVLTVCFCDGVRAGVNMMPSRAIRTGWKNVT